MIKSITLVAALLIATPAMACNLYGKIGAGVKFVEADRVEFDDGQSTSADFGSNPTARFELGCEVGNWSFGVSHDSQYFSGAPFNDDKEYHKTEVFVDYKINLGKIHFPKLFK